MNHLTISPSINTGYNNEHNTAHELLLKYGSTTGGTQIN